MCLSHSHNARGLEQSRKSLADLGFFFSSISTIPQNVSLIPEIGDITLEMSLPAKPGEVGKQRIKISICFNLIPIQPMTQQTQLLIRGKSSSKS